MHDSYLYGLNVYKNVHAGSANGRGSGTSNKYSALSQGLETEFRHQADVTGGVSMNSKKVSERLEKELLQVRQKKIQRLRSRINTGRYYVNNLELAKALLLSS